MQTKMRTFARSCAHPTGSGFFVANAGETKPVPVGLLPQLERAGAFDEKFDLVTEEFAAGDRQIINGRDSGRFFVTGPEFGAAEAFRTAAEVRAYLEQRNAAVTPQPTKRPAGRKGN